MSKKYTRQQIYNRYIKNRFASQHPKWILELPKQFVDQGYATLQNGEYEFKILPKPHEVTQMLQDNAALLSIAVYEQRIKPTYTYLGLKIRKRIAIGLLITFLLADVLYIGVKLNQRRQTHVRTNPTAINL